MIGKRPENANTTKRGSKSEHGLVAVSAIRAGTYRTYSYKTMNCRTVLFLLLCSVGHFVLPESLWSQAAAAANPTDNEYQTTRPSPDGIGKLYLGREIAQVMGHQGAPWLDRPERAEEEGTDKLVAELRRRLKPDAVVADIGAGSGYYSFRIAPLVPRGEVLAEDIEPEMLRIIQQKEQEPGHESLENVHPLLGTTTDPKLPVNGVDCVLLVDTYHEWDHPREMMTAILRELKPGGQVIQLEYRAEDPSVQILPHHKMTEAQARREMEAVGLRWLETKHTLPQQHLLIYEKPKA